MTAATSSTINAEIKFDCRPSDLFRILTDSTLHEIFSCQKATIAPVENTEISLYGGYISGKVVKIEKPGLIELEWRHADWDIAEPVSSVRFEIKAGDANDTVLVFEHRNVPKKALSETEKGWETFYWKPIRVMLGTRKHGWDASGAICHVDLPCYDLPRIQKFYGDLFNWSWSAWKEDYATFSGPFGSLSGGAALIKPQEGGKPSAKKPRVEMTPDCMAERVCLYINVKSIEDTLEQIEKAGGKNVRGKEPIGTFGFDARFLDTEGNLVGLYQSAL
eukprot:ANDGO_05949.mRNA.1 hypothetical protein